MKLLLAAAVALALLVPPPSAAHDVAPSPETAWIGGMATAAKAWLGSLGKPGGAQLPFDADARKDWHYVPRRRPGVALRDMTMPQRAAAIALLRAGLSARGAARAEAIMALEAVLAELEGTSRRIRDPLNYAFAVFGSPGVPPWGWRVEGHHLSIHVTVAADGHAAVTPLFTGSNPARIPGGPREGEQIHRLETQLGLELAQSLDARQLAGASLQERSLGDIVTGPGRAGALAHAAGPARGGADGGAAGQAAPARRGLHRPRARRVGSAVPGARARGPRRRPASRGRAGRREGTAYYYRIHGPRILIELDNTQNDANHVHSVWRDPVNDFGRDDLRAHYAAGVHSHGEGR